MKRKVALLTLIVLTVSILSVTVFCSCAKDGDAAFFENAICYKDFGAVGDGKTDDFDAIKAAHESANKNGLPVKADKNATYFIGAHESTVTVKTSTDWGNAKFVIDDKSASEEGQVWWFPLFDVRPNQDAKTVDLPQDFALQAGQKNVGLTFDFDVLLYVVNKNKKDFVRYGNNQDDGDSRQEVVLVDKQGNVSQQTPILRSYDQVTKMVAYPADQPRILLRGGQFTTVANDDSTVRHYFNRGIDVRRSNVTVKNVTHLVTGEGATGSPYNGFFRANFANNVTFENCVMTAHKTYKNQNGVDQGTYDTRLNCCNNVTYKNCTQSNDICDTTFWGVMCSDYCKNLVMDGCNLSRFDAHKGVYNATVKNSTLGQNISVVGGGLLLLEKVVRLVPEGSTGLNRFVTLRYDYGSFWDGDVVLRNCTLKTSVGLNYVLDAHWYNWDFGFACTFPKTVTLENVTIEYTKEVSYKRNYVFGFITEVDGQTPDFMKTSNNPVTLTQKIVIKNTAAAFEVTANKLGWFADTVVEK